MSTPSNQKPERSSTYFVQDRSNREELQRVHLQDQVLTRSMGGVLPEQSNPAAIQRVLDVGCGTGNWLIELAKSFPTIQTLIGVDVSRVFVLYAREQAAAAHVSDRVEFHTMDGLRMLEFPTAYFDLVNHRLGISWLRTWDWPKLLQEYQRVTKPWGVVRVTEGSLQGCSSSAVQRINELVLQALYQAGHIFTPTSDGLMSQLASLLHKYGLREVQTRSYTLDYPITTPEGQAFAEDLKLGYRTIVPFLRKWMRVPDDYEDLYQQMLSDMQQPDFVATMGLLTAWGKSLFDAEVSPDFPR
ncbi:MAG TPA: class I SAM-dependent methyltransferase [Ktedonobacteraceae bacterium]|nr:class I SAM-dependent methyltransferase [Ktedonobacteraceae bacterium]